MRREIVMSILRNIVFICFLIFGAFFLGGKLFKQSNTDFAEPSSNEFIDENVSKITAEIKDKALKGILEKSQTLSKPSAEIDQREPVEVKVDDGLNSNKEVGKESKKESAVGHSDEPIDAEDRALTAAAIVQNEASDPTPIEGKKIDRETQVDFKRIQTISEKYARVSEIMSSFE